MKDKIILIALVIMALAFVYLRFSPSKPAETQMRVGDVVVVIELADTVGEQRKGLSGREPLPDKHGMLFPMARADYHNFWMKDMKFDLDIFWIRDNKIVDISDNVPAPVRNEIPVTVQPKEPADHVLELNADFVEKYGVKIGDGVEMLTD